MTPSQSRLTSEQRAKIEAKTTNGETVCFRKKPVGVVEDEVSRICGEGEYKNFLQRIRLHEAKATELGSVYAYRWCYYSFSDSGDKLTFGQYALLMSENQLQEILTEARNKGWLF
jgi:hypothetical protein